MISTSPWELSSMRVMNESPIQDTDWRVPRECQLPAFDRSNYADVINSSALAIPNDIENAAIVYEGVGEYLTGVYFSEDEGFKKTLVARFSAPQIKVESDVSLQKWVGQVLEVFSDGFTARLTDITAKGAKEDAEFTFSEIADDDFSLLEPGAIFYWAIGRRYDAANRPSIASELRFRRLPDWSEEEIDNAALEAEELAKKFGIA